MMHGTARGFTPETMRLIGERIAKLASSIAAGFGASATTDYKIIYPPLVNHAAEARYIADVAADLVGEDNIARDGTQLMASEDFSFMPTRVPAPSSISATATAKAAARFTTPITISTTPSCRSAPRCGSSWWKSGWRRRKRGALNPGSTR